MESKANLPGEFVRVEHTRVDESIALHALFVFDDDFDAGRQRAEDRVLDRPS